MSGVFVITTDRRERLRFPFPLTEDEMRRYMRPDLLPEDEGGRLSMEIGSIGSIHDPGVPPIQIYFEFPEPCGE